MASDLYQIQESIQSRVDGILSTHPDWPCRKGCDECCRSLASPPRVSRAEWESIAAALAGLPSELAAAARKRIRDSAHAERPVICPLLDIDSASCLIYEARPTACRAYGFYAEREYVLGCSRIQGIGEQDSGVVWGNHAALEERLDRLGPALELAEWLSQGS